MHSAAVTDIPKGGPPTPNPRTSHHLVERKPGIRYPVFDFDVGLSALGATVYTPAGKFRVFSSLFRPV